MVSNKGERTIKWRCHYKKYQNLRYKRMEKRRKRNETKLSAHM